jgi:hypothetical protein
MARSHSAIRASWPRIRSARGPVPVFLGAGDDADAVALELPLQGDEGGVVAAEPVEAGDEQHLVLAAFGAVHEGEQHEPVLPAEHLPFWTPPLGRSVTTSTSSRPCSAA